jgi:hypothetical protein
MSGMLLFWIGTLFEADNPAARPPRDFTKFDLGVCPGCRGLRAVQSSQCTACGSTSPVTADA